MLRDSLTFGSEITQDVLFDLGIPEKEYSIYEESQLSILSILIHCRKYEVILDSLSAVAHSPRRCKEGVFVDRAEYNDAKILACPLPNCTHAWCKSCHQTIKSNIAGPPHSCDGSSELQHLMNKQGWKHCPGELLVASNPEMGELITGVYRMQNACSKG